jgi:predicted anti-sigma-YlaC factor YlaD
MSARRDGEAGDDPAAARHLQTCGQCRSWERRLDSVTRNARLRAPVAPEGLRTTLPGLAARRRLDPTQVARWLLATAAVTGVLTVIAGMAGVGGHAHFGTVDGRSSWALKLALVAGFAIAAWKPQRFAAGLLPVATVAALLSVVMSLPLGTALQGSWTEELLHLPVLVGAVATLIAWRAGDTPPALGVTARDAPHAQA